jgi:hypothetical protein
MLERKKVELSVIVISCRHDFVSQSGIGSDRVVPSSRRTFLGRREELGRDDTGRYSAKTTPTAVSQLIGRGENLDRLSCRFSWRSDLRNHAVDISSHKPAVHESNFVSPGGCRTERV